MAQFTEDFLFLPTSVSGCRLWLDAADRTTITLSGNNVTAWRDKIANFSLSGSTPYTTISNRPTVQFNGSTGLSASGYPYSSVCTNNTNFTTFLIQTTRSTTGLNRIPFDLTNSGNAAIRMMIFVNSSGGLFVDAGSQSSPRLFSGTNFTVNVPQLLVICRSGATGDNVVYRKNGAQDSILTTGGSSFSSNTYNVALSSSLGLWTGEMYEVIHYNNSITDEQIQQIEGYLSWKWGLQANLPSTHPFRNYRPLANPPITTQVPPMPLVTKNRLPFIPTQLSGCVLWLDAADRSSMALSGNAITTWRDKSGQGNNATAFNSPTLSGSNVTMNGTNQYFTCPNVSYRPINIFSVATYTGSGEGTLIRKGLSTGVSYEFGISVLTTTGLRYEIRTSGGGQINVNSTVSSTSGIQLYEMTYDNTTGIAYFNGTSLGSGTASGPMFSGSTPLFLGAYSGDGGTVAGAYFPGSFQEFIIYTTTPTTAQRQQIEGYLSWKWGLASRLPAGHPYKNQPLAPFPFTLTPYIGNLKTWLPFMNSGLSLWLDGADPNGTGILPANGSSLTTWRDKSGNGKNFTANGTPGTYSTTKKALVLSNNRYDSTYSAIVTNETLFIVFLPTLNQSMYIFYPQPLTGGRGVGTYGSASMYGIVNGDVAWGATTSGLNGINTMNIGVSVVNNQTNTQVSANGGSLTNVTTVPAFSAGNTKLGVYDGSLYSWYGDVYEIVAYNSVLTTPQRQNVEGYLAWKWGLVASLPANHPYKLFPPKP